VCLGDYIDRGPDSKQVLDFLIRRQTDQGAHFVCLRGNHEEMLLRAADKQRSDRDLMTWWGNGGEATLDSYGVDDPSDLPAEHLDWMRSLPLHTWDAHRVFVHAGVRPGIALSSQTVEDLLWIREPFLSSAESHGAFVVHGHTPTPGRKPDLRPNRVNIDTGAYFGGPLTAAVFSDENRAPLFFVNDKGEISAPDE
jgi:serine/threonine protein phosphatase 1